MKRKVGDREDLESSEYGKNKERDVGESFHYVSNYTLFHQVWLPGIREVAPAHCAFVSA